MDKKILIGGLAALVLVAGACSAGSSNNAPAKASPAAATTPAPANTASPATAAGAQDFTLVNATGVEIDKVFISPHDSNDWEEDVLGQDTLPDGQSVDIKFHRDEKAGMWDLKIADKQGTSIEWENLNLLEISKVTLNYKDGKATAKTE